MLFLDDELYRWNCFRKRIDGTQCRWVRTATDCIFYLKNEQHDIVYLDHDLPDSSIEKENTGMHVVRWLETNCCERLKETKFIVHSWNTIAAMEMCRRLKQAGYTAVYMPFRVESLAEVF